MKIALAQINFHIGNFSENENKIIKSIQKAEEQGVDLVIFPELAITGYPPRDFLEFNDFIDKAMESIYRISSFCQNTAALIGGPSRNDSGKGKPLYNSAYFLYEGRVKQIFHKTLLPTYDIFDEYRYFEPNKEFKLLEFKGKEIAITICEDLWNIDDNPLYYSDPMVELSKMNPDFVLNISASPFHYKQAALRKDVLKRNAAKYKLPIYYVNHVGAQTELVFDGGSMAINSSGEIVKCLNYFEEDFAVVLADDIEEMAAINEEQHSEIQLIHDALVVGIKNYFQKLGFKKAILGLSGGIDSAVTLVLAVKALGNANVSSILMPSQFSSDHSISDSVKLTENLKSPYETINIQEAYGAFSNSLEPYFKGLPFNIAEENLQARIRGVLLMAFSNKFGPILLNTSNKSEAAVGYGTLYGDMNGGLSVLGDVYKTQVFDLARYINRKEEVIPENIITKPPSAELRPDQKDSDSLPDYAILDKILFHYIEERKGPQEIIALGFEKAIVERTLKMVNTNEHKRYQTPPILRISSKAFGMGRRIPIVARYLS